MAIYASREKESEGSPTSLVSLPRKASFETLTQVESRGVFYGLVKSDRGKVTAIYWEEKIPEKFSVTKRGRWFWQKGLPQQEEKP
jgi:hypothetical protein